MTGLSDLHTVMFTTGATIEKVKQNNKNEPEL